MSHGESSRGCGLRGKGRTLHLEEDKHVLVREIEAIEF